MVNEYIKEVLEKEKDYFINKRGYSGKTVDEVCKILKADLIKRIDKVDKLIKSNRL